MRPVPTVAQTFEEAVARQTRRLPLRVDTGDRTPTLYTSEPGTPGNDEPDERHDYDA